MCVIEVYICVCALLYLLVSLILYLSSLQVLYIYTSLIYIYILYILQKFVLKEQTVQYCSEILHFTKSDEDTFLHLI